MTKLVEKAREMKTIRVTSQDESGVQIYNDRVMVMTLEDAAQIQKTFKDYLEVVHATTQRFETLEKLIGLLDTKISLLEKILKAKDIVDEAT